jgi:hypothetical protein
MNTQSAKSSSWGFSTPATMVNVAIVSLAMLGSGSFGPSSMHKVATMANYSSLNNQGQNASSLIAEDIRRASAVESASPDSIVLKTTFAGQTSRLCYVYDAKSRTLTRSNEQDTQTILTGVDSFAFSLFQRPAADAPYAKFAPASASDARLVGCRWSCSRKLAGSKMDSETIELAPIVLRNHC